MLIPFSASGLQLPAKPNADTKYFIEATDSGGTNPAITLTPVTKPPQKTPGTWGNVAVTPFTLSPSKGAQITTGAGPTEVPQFGAYTYSVTGVNGGKWTSATGGGLQIPDPTKPSNAIIHWADGPVVAKAVYEASTQYIWDLSVNIFKVTVATPAGEKAAQAGTVTGTINGPTITIKSEGLVMRASVTVTGPNGTAGLQHLTVGFVQNLMPSKTTGTYQVPGGATQTDTVFAPDINSVIDGGKFWDTQNPAYKASLTTGRKFYSIDPKTQLSGQDLVTSQTNPISTVDAPGISIPIAGPVGKGFANMIRSTVVWNFNIYVAVITNEAPTLYVPEAYMPWAFDGSGTVAKDPTTGMLGWTLTGTGVTFPPDSNNPAWTPATQGTAPPTTNGVQFNSIVQDPKHPVRLV